MVQSLGDFLEQDKGADQNSISHFLVGDESMLLGAFAIMESEPKAQGTQTRACTHTHLTSSSRYYVCGLSWHQKKKKIKGSLEISLSSGIFPYKTHLLLK